MANRYQSSVLLRDREGKRYFSNSVYPEIPENEDDIYVITTGTDRYDKLALQFYQDSSLWWVIAMANTSKTDSLAVKQGIQLRIPANPGNIVSLYEEFNANR